MVKSLPQDARKVPCLLKHIELILPVCPFMVFSISPDSLSHNFIDASSEPEAKQSIMGWNAIFVILLLWPCKTNLSGCLGRPSFWPPIMALMSFSSLYRLMSSSRAKTCLFSLATDFHLVSRILRCLEVSSEVSISD